MIYLDASAMAKLLVVEAETGALQEWLTEHHEYPMVTSTIGSIELQRVARRLSASAEMEARRLLKGLGKIVLDDNVIADAGDIGLPSLCTLDAIHLAAARLCGDLLVGLVTYNVRLTEAASDLGLPVISPSA